jgi:hypothetical protein
MEKQIRLKREVFAAHRQVFGLIEHERKAFRVSEDGGAEGVAKHSCIRVGRRK